MKRTVKIIISLALAVFSIISVVKISYVEPEKTFSDTIQELQEKQTKVIEMAGASAVASSAVAAIPGDATTPIANEIASISSKLLVVFCAIIIEKYLVTATWVLTFRFLVPAISALIILFLLFKREMIFKVALKLAVFAVAITVIIPVSMKIGTSIENNHIEAYNQSVSILDEFEKTKEETNKTADKASKTNDKPSGNFYEQAKSYLSNLNQSVESLINQMKEKADIKVERIKLAVSNLVEAIAVLIVTSCIIPILNLLIMFWLIKVLFGIDVQSPINRLVAKGTQKISSPYKNKNTENSREEDDSQPSQVEALTR